MDLIYTAEISAIPKEEISAIIGFWRMGAKEEKISKVTGLNETIIIKIIKQYINHERTEANL